VSHESVNAEEVERQGRYNMSNEFVERKVKHDERSYFNVNILSGVATVCSL